MNSINSIHGTLRHHNIYLNFTISVFQNTKSCSMFSYILLADHLFPAFFLQWSVVLALQYRHLVANSGSLRLSYYHITWGIYLQHWVKRQWWGIVESHIFDFLTLKPRSAWPNLKYFIFFLTDTVMCINIASFMKIHNTYFFPIFKVTLVTLKIGQGQPCANLT